MCFVFFAFVCLSVCSLFIVRSGDHFSSELKNMRGDTDQVNDVRNRMRKHFLARQPLEDHLCFVGLRF